MSSHKTIPLLYDIKLRVPLTKKYETIKKENVCFILTKEQRIIEKDICRKFYSLKVYSKHTIFHPNLDSPRKIVDSDLSHPDEAIENFTYYQDFCAPLDLKAIWENPEIGAAELTHRLSSTNLGDALGNTTHLDNHVSIIEEDKALNCKSCNIFIKNNTPPLLRIIKLCPSCYQKGYIPESIGLIESEGFYIKQKENNFYSYTSTNPDFTITSNYYSIIDLSTINQEELILPKTDTGMFIVGLGSAGTNILNQLAKTELISNFVLIDYDSVEEQNLRNQWYIRNQISTVKTIAAKSNLSYFSPSHKNVITYTQKYNPKLSNRYKAKYVLAGLDNLETRQEILETIKQDPESTRYLIDARYDNLSASLYLIDTHQPDQLKYYEEQLLADKKQLEDNTPAFVPWTEEEVKEILWASFMNCETFAGEIIKMDKGDYKAIVCPNDGKGCRHPVCLKNTTDLMNRRQTPRSQTNTCLARNIIDIYTYTSSFVTAAIRQIEEKNPQPFVHIETSTDPMPVHMILRTPEKEALIKR